MRELTHLYISDTERGSSDKLRHMYLAAWDCYRNGTGMRRIVCFETVQA